MTPPLPRRRRWTEHFVTGLFILAPAYVTFLVVRFIVGQINRIFSPLFRWLDPYLTSAWADLVAHAGTLVIFVVAVTVIGWGTKILVLRRIFGAVEDRRRILGVFQDGRIIPTDRRHHRIYLFEMLGSYPIR